LYAQGVFLDANEPDPRARVVRHGVPLREKTDGLEDTVKDPVGVTLDFSDTVSLFEFDVRRPVFVLTAIDGILSKHATGRVALRQLVLAHGSLHAKAGSL
jgi:hypothetical protein